MPKPLIGLTTSCTAKSSNAPKYAANELYAKAISSAGGLPVLVPLNISNDDLESLVIRLDGVLFTGGNDIDPRQYGNQPHPKVAGIDCDRDRVEIFLVKEMVQSNKPFMGICRGFQVINVALGGTLYEHLPEQHPGSVIHDNHDLPRNFMAHTVTLDPGNNLSRIFAKKQEEVNSLHHQGIRRLAQDLLPTAYAPDDLIEAFELPGFSFGLAVQWHPEELLASTVTRKLFDEFVHTCYMNSLK